MVAKKKAATEKEPDQQPDSDQQVTGLDRRVLLNFALLDTRIDELKAELKEKEAARKVQQEYILRQFEQSGIDSIRFLGHSIYLFTQYWAKPKDESVLRTELVAALKRNGFKEYIKEDFNVSSLSGRIRELDKQYREMHKKLPKEGRKPYQLGDYLPKALVAVLKLDPDTSIRIQGTIPTEDLLRLKGEVDKDHGNKP